MSSQKNISPQKEPANNRPPERFNPKVLLIFLAIISVMVVLWFSNVGTGANHQKLSVRQLLEAVEAGKIKEGTMKPDPSLGEHGYIIKGKMVNPAFKAGSSDSEVPGEIFFYP